MQPREMTSHFAKRGTRDYSYVVRYRLAEHTTIRDKFVEDEVGCAGPAEVLLFFVTSAQKVLSEQGWR